MPIVPRSRNPGLNKFHKIKYDTDPKICFQRRSNNKGKGSQNVLLGEQVGHKNLLCMIQMLLKKFIYTCGGKMRRINTKISIVTSLSFGFFVCRMRVMTGFPSQGCCNHYRRWQIKIITVSHCQYFLNFLKSICIIFIIESLYLCIFKTTVQHPLQNFVSTELRFLSLKTALLPV